MFVFWFVLGIAVVSLVGSIIAEFKGRDGFWTLLLTFGLLPGLVWSYWMPEKILEDGEKYLVVLWGLAGFASIFTRIMRNRGFSAKRRPVVRRRPTEEDDEGPFRLGPESRN